jgi:hypothetical protein
LESKFDKSKAFTVGEIRGTDLEKQINGGLSDLSPDDLNVYLGDIMVDFQGMRIFEKHTESFDNIFKNEFIYRLEADFRFRDLEQTIKTSMEIYDNGNENENGGQTAEEFIEFTRSMVKNMNSNAALCRQQLYDIVQLNIQPGEVVEIFSEWGDHQGLGSGPPAKVVAIAPEQISTSELLDLQDNVKFEICRAV